MILTWRRVHKVPIIRMAHLRSSLIDGLHAFLKRWISQSAGDVPGGALRRQVAVY